MIAGATRGKGGPALPQHLENDADNDAVLVGPVRGLVSDPADGNALMRELEGLQSHARTRRPIHHVHADAPPGLASDREQQVRRHFWALYEDEFGLGDAAFFSRVHVKHGRVHEHRVYGLGRPDGSVVSMSFDMPRREEISRLTEIECGLPLTPGAHNRAVIAAFEREGRHHAAAAMRAARLHEVARPRATMTPWERAQQERTGVALPDLAATVAQAWHETSDGTAFASALSQAGLSLASGHNGTVILDAGSNVHAAHRLLSLGATAANTAAPTAAAIRDRLLGIDLLPVEDQKAASRVTSTSAVAVRRSVEAGPTGTDGKIPPLHQLGTASHTNDPVPDVGEGDERIVVSPKNAAIAVGRLIRSLERSARILAMEPHADPAARDAHAIEKALVDVAIGREQEARSAATAARQRAAVARAALGISDRVGQVLRIPTHRATDARRLEADAAECSAAAETQRFRREHVVQSAPLRAREIAHSRSRERSGWWERPDVILASREDRLDRQALAAVRGGSRRMAELVATHGVHAARRALLNEDSLLTMGTPSLAVPSERDPASRSHGWGQIRP